MEIIKPLSITGDFSITPSMLTSSTIPEPDTALNEVMAAFSDNPPYRPYAKDELAVQPTTHVLYKNIGIGTKSIITMTGTIGNPVTVNWTNHGAILNTPFRVSTTGSALPPIGMAATYYVVPVNANSFRLSAAPSGAALNVTSTSQSGIHTGFLNFDLLDVNLSQLTSDPTKWQKMGYSNKFNMFDKVVNTKSRRASSIQHVINPGQIVNAVGFVGMNAASIRVRNNTGYDVTKNLDGTTIVNWGDFFFEQSEAIAETFFLGLGNNANPTLTFDINKTGTAEGGEVILGRSYTVGGMEYGVTAGTTNYSVKNTDVFGNKTITPRAKANRFSGRVMILNTEIGKIKRLLDSILDIPCFFIGVQDVNYSATLNVYGFIKDFQFQHEYTKHSLYTIEIEGLI